MPLTEAAAWFTAVGALVGIVVAILQVGTIVGTLTSSVNSLTESVKSLESRFDTYVATDVSHNQTLNGWQREVDSRLASIETKLEAAAGRRRIS